MNNPFENVDNFDTSLPEKMIAKNSKIKNQKVKPPNLKKDRMTYK